MKCVFAAATIYVAFASSAIAAPVTINFTAEGVSTYGLGDSGEALEWLGVSEGDTITGSFTYNDEFSNYRLEDDWEFAIDLHSTMSLTIGGTTYNGLTGRTYSSNVFHDIDYFYPERLLSLFEDGFNALPGVIDSSVYVLAFDRDNALWDGVVRSADDLNQAARRELQISLISSAGTRHDIVSSNLVFSTAPVAPVPLPAGGALLISGLLGLGIIRRFKG